MDIENRKSALAGALLQEKSVEAHASSSLLNGHSEPATPEAELSRTAETPEVFTVLVGTGQNARTLVAQEASHPTGFVMAPNQVTNDFIAQGREAALALWLWLQEPEQMRYVTGKGKNNPAKFAAPQPMTQEEILDRYPKKMNRKRLRELLDQIEEVTGLYVDEYRDEYTGRPTRTYSPGKRCGATTRTYVNLSPGDTVGTSADVDLGLVRYSKTKAKSLAEEVQVSGITGISQVAIVDRPEYVESANPPAPRTRSSALLGSPEVSSVGESYAQIGRVVGRNRPVTIEKTQGITTSPLAKEVLKEVQTDIQQHLHQEVQSSATSSTLATEKQLLSVKANIKKFDWLWFEFLGISGYKEMTMPQASSIINAYSKVDPELRDEFETFRKNKQLEAKEKAVETWRLGKDQEVKDEQVQRELRLYGKEIPAHPRGLSGEQKLQYSKGRAALEDDPGLQPSVRFARLMELREIVSTPQLQGVAK